MIRVLFPGQNIGTIITQLCFLGGKLILSIFHVDILVLKAVTLIVIICFVLQNVTDVLKLYKSYFRQFDTQVETLPRIEDIRGKNYMQVSEIIHNNEFNCIIRIYAFILFSEVIFVKNMENCY